MSGTMKYAPGQKAWSHYGYSWRRGYVVDHLDGDLYVVKDSLMGFITRSAGELLPRKGWRR